MPCSSCAANPRHAIAGDSAINASTDLLRQIGALDEANDDCLTPLGFHLATLPVDVRIGKMLIYGAIFGCVEPVLTMAAAMGFRSPFFSPIDKRDEADKVRKSFGVAHSDHLTTLKAMNGWVKAKTVGRREASAYCQVGACLSSLQTLVLCLQDVIHTHL